MNLINKNGLIILLFGLGINLLGADAVVSAGAADTSGAYVRRDRAAERAAAAVRALRKKNSLLKIDCEVGMAPLGLNRFTEYEIIKRYQESLIELQSLPPFSHTDTEEIRRSGYFSTKKILQLEAEQRIQQLKK